MDVYSKCTACYNDLTDEEKEINVQYDNIYNPMCKSCLETIKEELYNKINED